MACTPAAGPRRAPRGRAAVSVGREASVLTAMAIVLLLLTLAVRVT